MSRAKEATAQTLVVLFGRSLGIVASLVSVLFVTRWLQTRELILTQIASLLAELIATIGDLGFGLAMQRRLPALLEADVDEANGMIGTFLVASLATLAVGATIIYLLSEQIASSFVRESGEGAYVVLAIPAVAVQIWRTQLFVLMQGTREFGRYSILSLTFQLFWVAGSIGFYFVWGFKGFLIGMAVGSAIPCSYETWKMRHYLVMPPAWRKCVSFFRLALSYYPERFVNFAYCYADQWVVAYALRDQQALATYFVPRRFFDQLLALLEGFWSVPTNALSRESARGPAAISSSLASFKRVFLYIFAPLTAGLLASSYFLVDILAGPKYHDAVWSFAILSLFFLVSGVFAPQAISVMVLAKPSERLKSLLAQNISFLLILPILAHVMGLEGVAIARVLAGVVMAWISCMLVKRIVDTPRDLSPFRAVLPAFFILLAIGGLPQLFYYHRLVTPLYLAIGSAAYIWVFMRLVREDDVLLLEHVLPRRLAWVATVSRWCRPSRPVVQGI
jgi:O-antigen/teichoic acid export membrane protein